MWGEKPAGTHTAYQLNYPDNWGKKTGKLYAEKLLIVEKDQVTPLHFHWRKMEDIINRGGSRLMFQLYNSTADGEVDRQSEIQVSIDGVRRVLSAGARIGLEPGESLTLPQGLYHTFWSDDGRVLIGEVSLVNDDHTDNRFSEKLGRFPIVEEDELPLYLLVNDYSRYYKGLAKA